MDEIIPLGCFVSERVAIVDCIRNNSSNDVKSQILLNQFFDQLSDSGSPLCGCNL